MPRSASAITAIAFGWPFAVRRVPSSGSTATSTAGPVPVADLLAVEEHRRLVLLALADHDDAGHRDRVEHGAHRRPPPPGRRPPSRRGRSSGRRRAPPPRSRGRARARGCGPAVASRPHRGRQIRASHGGILDGGDQSTVAAGEPAATVEVVSDARPARSCGRSRYRARSGRSRPCTARGRTRERP